MCGMAATATMTVEPIVAWHRNTPCGLLQATQCILMLLVEAFAVDLVGRNGRTAMPDGGGGFAIAVQGQYVSI